MLEQVKTQQDETQAQGQRLLASMPIEQICNKYGKYILGGSFVYGLMLSSKRDIDGYILTDKLSLETGLALLDELIKLKGVKRVALENNLEGSWEHDEPSIVVQVKIPFESKLWNFDIHMIEENDWEKFSYLNHKKFSDKERDKILLLKAQLQERGLYPGSKRLRGSFASVDVYTAVLEDGVETVDQMVEWGKNRKTFADKFKEAH